MLDLICPVDVVGADQSVGRPEGRETYHALEDFGYLSHGKFDSQTYSFFLFILSVFILVLDFLQQLLGLLLVGAMAQTGVAGELAVFVDYAQADYLVAIFHQLLNEPLDSVVGVVIVVGAAEEGPRSLSVLIVLVFGGYVEGVIGCIAVVEGVKGDSALVFSKTMLVQVSEAHSIWTGTTHDVLSAERLTVTTLGY